MDSTYFLRQLDIADPARFEDKRVTVNGDWGDLCKEDQVMTGLVGQGVPGA